MRVIHRSLGTSVRLASSGWPLTKTNTILNICNQGETHIVERLGKLNRVVSPGMYFTIPIIDRIAMAYSINPQGAVSKDNVSVAISGVLYIKITDAKIAAYGHADPIYGIIQHAQSAMRAAVGDMELDQLWHDRTLVNTKIKTAISSAAESWGMVVLRYEVTEIKPDTQISIAMDKQAAAERTRREKVLQATGDKESAVLRSEGDLIRRTNEAEAGKRELQKQAEGDAIAMRTRADAQAHAIEVVSAALSKPGGEKSAQVELARNYMEMMGEIGKKSNTIFFGEQPGNIESMMARVATALRVGGAGEGKQ